MFKELAQKLFDAHTASREADTVRQSSEADSEHELGLLRQFILERPADVAAFLPGRQLRKVSWQPSSTQLAFGSRLTSEQLNASVDAAGTLTYSHKRGAVLPLGVTKVSVTWQPASEDAAAVTVTKTFTVKRAQSIALSNPGARKLSARSVAVAAKATSGLNVKLASGTSSVCTVSGNKVSFKKKGVCVVKGSQAGNGSFAPAPTAVISFRIG